ncbi:MAG TPA: Nif3-like dinuclear metal center hexameric protein [Tepidisphaeraceae bacterium]
MSVPMQDLLRTLEEIAPLRDAEPWDNVGLLVGDPTSSVSSALLCIDYTESVYDEMVRGGHDILVAYHPPIFDPLKRVLASGLSSLVYKSIRQNFSIYSPHTALDVATGGTNDVLGDILGLSKRQPLKLVESKAREYKLATSVPPKDLEKVADAIFAAGGGGIGAYTRCSFRYDGTGTFQGDDTTNPAVGKAGEDTKVTETKIEVLVDAAHIQPAVAAIKTAHPYEVPAIDLHPLTALPTGRGIGRVGKMQPGVARGELFERIKSALGAAHLLIAGPTDGIVETAACCAGAGGSLLDDALRWGAQLYLTGELRHHDALKAAAAGMTVVCTLHSNSERLTLAYLERRLAEMLPGLAVHQSRADRDPFAIL